MNSPLHRRVLIAVGGLLALGAVVAAWRLPRAGSHPPVPGPATSSLAAPAGAEGRISPELAARWQAIEAAEQRTTETVWATETLASRCAATVEAFWDRLNAATNKLRLAGSFPADRFQLGTWEHARSEAHGIETRESTGPGPTLDRAAWARRLEELARDGWRLLCAEFRHTRFETDAGGAPARSRFYFSAHLTRGDPPEQAIVEGDLGVDWDSPEPGDSGVPIRRIDARGVEIRLRRGPPPFEPVLAERIEPPPHSLAIDPLVVRDLDGDGLSEIILAGRNLVFRRQADGGYRAEPLCRFPPGVVATAVIADFDGDGLADLLAQTLDGLLLVAGSSRGTFEERGRLAWPASPEVKWPMVLTCGDIDGDGDADVLLGQYKDPYEGGATPAPYYAANDGHPSFLLLNDGHGRFSDATVAAGLGDRRRRRMYSASLADLDADQRLDLITVSDFAGIDLYRNDGGGRFTEMTDRWVTERHAFGMAHALADFNADGRLDVLMIGMTSPTVERLEHLGLARTGTDADPALRAPMTHGNRLYLAAAGGGFREGPAAESIARSGWSWGCTASDFDNDGFPDVYIANGLETRETVRDYEAEYWLHDQHLGTRGEDPAAYLYFRAKFARTRGRGQSYGGYEKNRLYLNRGGESFLEAAHLFGVGLERDSRNVVGDDLDGDGRVDLVVTTFETWPEPRQTLRLFRNTLPDTGHWIAFRFRDEAGTGAAAGIRVSLDYAGRKAVRQLVTGDSHRSQHSTTLHFGLGAATRVDRAEVAWPDGRRLTLRNLEAGRSHDVSPPSPPARRGR